ncbi:hypothetical protein Patl1_01241 [Pistacia atlantica]|uniref:Uncharacterized protein n=1 Tax=Pistacia atlantica TaxID=434234 RepID=A0ACC1C6H3_9ROSI|nr:hypothetical protein Patl1_01241 [Pistacia atlantica]
MDTRQPSSSNNNYKTESELVLKNEGLLYSILCKLPARSFASSACVCKTWHKVCNQILARPKIASAFSLNTTPRISVKEVVDKVLSAPIRPHFAIANVGRGFDFDQTIQWLAGSLGSQTPIIVSRAHGIMGRHAITDQFREVKFVDIDDYPCIHEGSSGIVLTVGFVPGLKVDAIPLLQQKRASQVAMIDQFVMDIRNYTISVSDCASPVGIIMFGDEDADLKLVIEKLDYALSMETVIVGDQRCQFFYRSGNQLRNVCESIVYDAVALVFASDKDKLHDMPGHAYNIGMFGFQWKIASEFQNHVFESSLRWILDAASGLRPASLYNTGKIQFHLALSKGVTAIGPRHKAVSVRANNRDPITWLTARREGNQQNLDGQQILDHIHDEMGNDVQCPELYIGVTKRRKCSIGSRKARADYFLGILC